MLNSTKTWQEKFSEAFGVYWSNYKNTLYRCNPNDILDRPSIINSEDIKQFISDLIAQTREETLKELIREYQDNELDGKGYDFYFSIRAKIDELNKLKK